MSARTDAGVDQVDAFLRDLTAEERTQVIHACCRQAEQIAKALLPVDPFRASRVGFLVSLIAVAAQRSAKPRALPKDKTEQLARMINELTGVRP